AARDVSDHDPEKLEAGFPKRSCSSDKPHHHCGRLLGAFAAARGGVLVYFGYPQAHEDDAERAVRAGLELVAAVGGLKNAPVIPAWHQRRVVLVPSVGCHQQGVVPATTL